jgi:hypothetical protein
LITGKFPLQGTSSPYILGNLPSFRIRVYTCQAFSIITELPYISRGIPSGMNIRYGDVKKMAEEVGIPFNNICQNM